MSLPQEENANQHQYFSSPIDVAVPVNNQHDDVARSIRDLTAALNHRYTNSLPQSIGDEQLLAIQKLESIFCPNKKPTSPIISVPTPVPLPAAVLHHTPVPEHSPITFAPILSSDPVPNVITQLSQDSLPAIFL